MPNKLPVPLYKPLDRVMESQKITMVTDKEHFNKNRKRYNSRKKGIIRSEAYKKTFKGGASHFYYDVQWDGRTHTDPMLQNRLMLEEN